MGMSPNCSDIEFKPKTILSRPGLGLRFTDSSAFHGMKSFYGIDRVRRLVTLQDSGKIAVETPEGQLTQIQHMYQPGMLMSAVYAFGRLFMAFSDGRRPADFPSVYDPISISAEPFPVRPVNLTPPINPLFAVEEVATPGLITPGLHYFFYTFEDRFGNVTEQSPVFSLLSTGQKIDFSAVLTSGNGADATTVRRRIWMTPAYVAGAGVAGFFNLGQLTIDNNAAAVLNGVSLSDATLQTGTPWDTSNLTLVQPQPAIGVTTFADRLVYWGVYETIPARLAQRIDGLGNDIVQLGAPDQSFTMSTGWVGSMGIINQATQYASVGTRTGYVGAAFEGVSYKDFPNALASSFADTQYWLTPGGRYGIMFRATAITVGQSVTVSLIAQPSGTILATKTVALPGVVYPELGWAVYTGDGVTNVPAGTTSIRYSITVTGAPYVYFDWIRPFLQQNKFNGSDVWIGDIQIPTNFDLVKSPLPVAKGGWEETRCCFEQSGNLYIVKEHSTWVTADNGDDPSTWNVDNVSFLMGTPSLHGVGLGPEFAIIAGREGVYRFDAGGMNKISQEIETTWLGVDWTQGHRLWVTVDASLKIIRVAVPLKASAVESPGVCHIILKCDYSEGWGEGWASDGREIGEAGNRKWSIDNVETSCAEMAEKDDGSSNLLLGGKRTSSNTLAANNFTVGSAPWVQIGTQPATPTYLQSQPMGPYPGAGAGLSYAAKWSFPFSSGTARYAATGTVTPALGGYFVASFWAKSFTAGVNVTATIRDPFGLADVAIVITPAWQRFVASFGPSPAGGITEVLDIDFGTLTAPITVVLFGAQLQSGRFDKGWSGLAPATGASIIGAAISSGFLSEPTVYDPGADPPWRTADWDGLITPTYEFAPFGSELGRSNFNRFVARIRGAGALEAAWVRPDGSLLPLNAGQFPQMATSPTNDVEMGGSASDTYVGLRLWTSGLTNWFALKRAGVFSKAHEGAPFRGKS